jgi:hypothetical protein
LIQVIRSDVMVLCVFLWVAGSLIFGWVSVFAQLLPPASDYVKLRVTQQEPDEDAAGRTQKAHAEALAKQFNVDPSVVATLRASKQGWGVIAIRLGMAQELRKTDSKSYPTLAEAMRRIGDLRTQKMGWGATGKELGLALGPVVSEVQRVRQEMRAEAKKMATEGVVTPGEALDRSQSERAFQSGHADKAQRPRRTEKSQSS